MFKFLLILFLNFFLMGCIKEEFRYKSQSLTAGAHPFYEAYESDGLIILVGYGYSPSSIDVFLYDQNSSVILDSQQYTEDGITSVCEGASGVLLSSLNGTQAVRHQEGKIVFEPINTVCLDKRDANLCNERRALFLGHLPGRDEKLTVCLMSGANQPSFFLESSTGFVTDLGFAGAAPSGPGRFVMTNGVEDGQYLLHHTRSAIAETSVIIDAEMKTVTSFAMPDLADVRPSRGFGAGKFGVSIHLAKHAVIAEVENGEIFLLRDGQIQKVAENVVARSLIVTNKGCNAVIVATQNGSYELRDYNICNN